MAIDTVPKLVTIGEIAKRLHVPPHRIQYIVQSRPHIKPRAIAAGARCFDDDAIARIRHELRSIAAWHGKGGAL